MSLLSKGRVAGLFYLGVVSTGIFTLAYAPGKLFVDGDAAATTDLIAANAGLLGAANVAALAMCAFFLALPFALARFLAPYGRFSSLLMILFVAASLPFSFNAIAQHFTLASLAEAGALTTEAVAARLDSYDKWMDAASIFWGLWLAPLGWLIVKSGAIPRVLGALLILGCLGYLVRYFGPLIYGGYADLPFRGYISMPGSIGEIGTCLWLLVIGARERADY